MFSLRKLQSKLIGLLPHEIRFSIIRQMIHIHDESINGFRFMVATTKDEIEQGFELLYDSYLNEGLMDANQTQLRITKYHLLPSSTMIIAKKGKEVVATVTHILDSSFGLPVETNVDLKAFKAGKKRVAEISALAIKKRFRRNHSLLFGLTRFLYFFAVENLGATHWIICINKKVSDYYKAIFFFNTIIEDFKYDFVNCSHSSVLYCDLQAQQNLFFNHYGQLSKSKNLYAFYNDLNRNKLHLLPEGNYKTASLPILNPDMLNYFFNHKAAIIQNLSENEKKDILNSYADPTYEAVVSILEKNQGERRRYARRIVNLTGFYINKYTNSIHSIFIANVSMVGLLIYCPVPIQKGDLIKLQIDISADEKIPIEAEVAAIVQSGKFAVKLHPDENPQWETYINNLEEYIKSYSLKPKAKSEIKSKRRKTS